MMGFLAYLVFAGITTVLLAAATLLVCIGIFYVKDKFF